MKKTLLLLAALILINCILNAGTITVQNTNNTGTGSLRQAVINAIEGDTIRFNPSLIALGSDTIKLDSKIAFTKGLVFKGLYNATDTLFISGENSVQIFNIDLSTAGNKILVIDSLVLIKGNVGSGSGNNGGAIFIKNSDSLLIFNSIFANNSADKGGAIFSHSPSSSSSPSSVTIANSTIINNSTTGTGGNGGGVYSSSPSSSSIAITNSTIINNSTTGIGANGGGVYSYSSDSSTIAITNSTIANNSTSTAGGGVYSLTPSSQSSSSSSIVTITNSTITNNSASSTGGVRSSSSSSIITVINSTITNNLGINGGGVYSSSYSGSSSIINTKGSIIAFNGGNNIYNNNNSTINSMGYNIFSNNSLSGSIATDYLGVTSCEVKLNSLENNGGTTLTLLPFPESIVINAGDPTDNSNAQNGSLVGRRDIGATEATDTVVTQDTLMLIVCDSMISPSGNYTWTTSGIYSDTVNASGCDSVITINLTVNYANAATLTQTVCDSMVSPSGNYTWTTSGTYSDTVMNASGCDSVITINLTVNYANTATLTQTVCDSMVSPSGKYTWTTSGTYSDTLMNASGCDSVITINLTVIYANTATLTQTVCDSMVSPSGNYTWTTSGTYSDTLMNASGCDSVITINLTVIYANTATLTQTVCDSMVSPSGKYTWTTSGTYSDTLMNASGCDSVITINLTVNYANAATLTQTACDSMVSPSGNYTWTTSGTYSDTLMNASGCDSVITINLTVNNIDTTVTISSSTLTSSETGAIYQWLNCNNGYTPILGATSQSFTATYNGNYAVEITKNTCIDTSMCINMNNVGVVETNNNVAAMIYPNPTNKQVMIELAELNDYTLVMMDLSGKEIMRKQLTSELTKLDISQYKLGIYLIRIFNTQKQSVFKLVVK